MGTTYNTSCWDWCVQKTCIIYIHFLHHHVRIWLYTLHCCKMFPIHCAIVPPVHSQTFTWSDVNMCAFCHNHIGLPRHTAAKYRHHIRLQYNHNTMFKVLSCAVSFFIYLGRCTIYPVTPLIHLTGIRIHRIYPWKNYLGCDFSSMPTLDSGLFKPPSQLGHGLAITPYCFTWLYFFYPCPNSDDCLANR